MKLAEAAAKLSVLVGRHEEFAEAVSVAQFSVVRHTHKSALTLNLRKVPDSYQRQNRGKNHEQTNRSPLSIWILHILLLDGTQETIEAPDNAFYLRSSWSRSRLPGFSLPSKSDNSQVQQ